MASSSGVGYSVTVARKSASGRAISWKESREHRDPIQRLLLVKAADDIKLRTLSCELVNRIGDNWNGRSPIVRELRSSHEWDSGTGSDCRCGDFIIIRGHDHCAEFRIPELPVLARREAVDRTFDDVLSGIRAFDPPRAVITATALGNSGGAAPVKSRPDIRACTVRCW